MAASTQLLRALKANVRALVDDLETAHKPVNPRDVAQRALVAHGPIVWLLPLERVAIVDAPAMNLDAVGDSLKGMEFGNDDDSTDEEDHLELHCEELRRALARQLGAEAPPWLRRVTPGELEGDEGLSEDERVHSG